jgi:hypothetical protein
MWKVPIYSFNATAECSYENRASMRGALTSVLSLKTWSTPILEVACCLSSARRCL